MTATTCGQLAARTRRADVSTVPEVRRRTRIRSDLRRCRGDDLARGDRPPAGPDRRDRPRIRSVNAVNPHALAEAESADHATAAGRRLSPLHGRPVLVKDNIDTAGLASTAGSLALADEPPARDAPLVRRLREAGMVVLGKTNLSEWANIRDEHATSGWSAHGGLTRNPYALNRTAWGSSSGSGAAVAARLAPFAIGTETNGSITAPAAACGLVGLKPTVGLVPTDRDRPDLLQPGRARTDDPHRRRERRPARRARRDRHLRVARGRRARPADRRTARPVGLQPGGRRCCGAGSGDPVRRRSRDRGRAGAARPSRTSTTSTC